MTKMTKRLLTLMAACVLAMGLMAVAGCGSQSSSGGDKEEAAPAAESSAPAEEATEEATEEAAEEPAEEPAGPAAVDGKVLNVGASTYSVDTSIDPLDGSWNYCYVCYEGLAETLFRITDDWGAEPWLAESAEPANEDGTVWTVTLRDDVTYHNGNKMTAETVKACLERAMEVSAQAKGILDITDIQADGQTLTLTLANPVADLQHELCNSVFVIYDAPADGEDYANGISYTGPFMPGEYEQGVYRTFVPYEGYYGGKANIDQVNYIVYADTAAQLVALNNGEIDFCMGVPFENLQEYIDNPDFEVSYADPNSDEMIYFNEARPGMDDVNVRQAIAMALDRDTACTDIYFGHAKPMYTIFSGDLFFFGGEDGLDLTVTEFDPEGAAQLLADAGWADTNGDGTLDKDGTELDLNLTCYPDEYIMNTADMLATQLKDLGIKVTINPTYDYPSVEASGDFDIMWTYEGVTRSGTPQYFLSNFLSTDGAGNHGGFSSEAVDEACEKLTGTTDEAEITALVKQAEQAVADDGFMITWAMRDIPFVYNSKVLFTPHAYRYYMIDQTTDIAE